MHEDNMNAMCHGCKQKYNNIYKGKRYSKWTDRMKRSHHWEECQAIQERRELVAINQHSYFGAGVYHGRGFQEIFHTNDLSSRLIHEIANELDRRYISDKHAYSECQPRYIDNITTAYHSDIMKGVLSHES